DLLKARDRHRVLDPELFGQSRSDFILVLLFQPRYHRSIASLRIVRVSPDDRRFRTSRSSLIERGAAAYGDARLRSILIDLVTDARRFPRFRIDQLNI